MGIKSKTIALLSGTAMLAACAGRDAHPVQVSQLGDGQKGCAELAAETNANEALLWQLENETDEKIAQNALMGVAGLFTLGLTWFAMDLKRGASTDLDALQARQLYLRNLMAVQKCDPSTVIAADAWNAETAQAAVEARRAQLEARAGAS